MGRYLEVAAVASSRAELSSQKTNERQLRPFGRTKWPQELLFRMLKGGTNGIDCGHRQADTSQNS
jgi:hypothetical protein